MTVADRDRGGSWGPLEAPPLSGRALAAAAAGAGRLVLWGGTDAEGPAGWRRDGAILDLAGGTWSRVPPAPIVPRRGAAIAVVTGGFVLWGGTTRDSVGRRQLADGGIYRFADAGWRTLQPAPLEPRTAVFAAGGGEVLVVWGGRRGVGRSTETLEDGAMLALGSGTWTRIVAPPVSLHAGAPPAWRDGRLVVVDERLRLLSYDPVAGWEPGEAGPASFATAGLTWWRDGLFARFGDGRCASWRVGDRASTEEQPFPLPASDYEHGCLATPSGLMSVVNARRPGRDADELLACSWRPEAGWTVEPVGLSFRRGSAIAVLDGRAVVWGGLSWPVTPRRARYLADGAISQV